MKYAHIRRYLASGEAIHTMVYFDERAAISQLCKQFKGRLRMMRKSFILEIHYVFLNHAFNLKITYKTLRYLFIHASYDASLSTYSKCADAPLSNDTSFVFSAFCQTQT